MFHSGRRLTPLYLALLLAGCKGAPKEGGQDGLVPRLLKECQQDRAASCLKAAVAHYKGHGVGRAPGQAAGLFERACDLGEMDGCFHLAKLLETGEGIRKDFDEALKRYRMACDGKLAPACWRVGAALFKGEEGRPREKSQAVEFFKKACDLKHGTSCFYVANAFRTGTGGLPRSDIQAAAFLQRSCDLEDRNGCAGLAMMLETGEGGLKKDPLRARALYKKACELGVLSACDALNNKPRRPPPGDMTSPARPEPRP